MANMMMLKRAGSKSNSSKRSMMIAISMKCTADIKNNTMILLKAMKSHKELSINIGMILKPKSTMTSNKMKTICLSVTKNRLKTPKRNSMFSLVLKLNKAQSYLI